MGNAPVTGIDYLGLECRKCAVNNLSLEIVGITIFSPPKSGYRFSIVGDVSFKTTLDGSNYDSDCCQIRQWVKHTFTVNGQPFEQKLTLAPGDNQWHIDQSLWTGPESDNPENADLAGENQLTEWDDQQTFVKRVVQYDAPGALGFSNGTSFSDDASFQWKVYDSCNGWKVVKESAVVHAQASGTWPDFSYSYTK